MDNIIGGLSNFRVDTVLSAVDKCVCFSVAHVSANSTSNQLAAHVTHVACGWRFATSHSSSVAATVTHALVVATAYQSCSAVLARRVAE